MLVFQNILVNLSVELIHPLIHLEQCFNFIFSLLLIFANDYFIMLYLKESTLGNNSELNEHIEVLS